LQTEQRDIGLETAESPLVLETADIEAENKFNKLKLFETKTNLTKFALLFYFIFGRCLFRQTAAPAWSCHRQLQTQRARFANAPLVLDFFITFLHGYASWQRRGLFDRADLATKLKLDMERNEKNRRRSEFRVLSIEIKIYGWEIKNIKCKHFARHPAHLKSTQL